MATSALARFNNTTVAAASSFAVALGLVAVPPQGGDAAVVRVEVALVQLRASIATETSAFLNTVELPTAEGALIAADATPHLNSTTETAPAAADTGVNVLQNLVLGVLAIAATPLWYLAFPVTLPLSIVGGITILQFLNALPLGFGGGGQGDPVSLGILGAVVGLGGFAVGPLAFAFSAISSAFAPASPAAAATATATVSSSATSVRDASSTAPTPVAVGKPSTKAVRADTRSAKPSPASATTAATIAESAPDFGNAPMTASDNVATENASARQLSKGASDKASDRSGASRERTRS